MDSAGEQHPKGIKGFLSRRNFLKIAGLVGVEEVVRGLIKKDSVETPAVPTTSSGNQKIEIPDTDSLSGAGLHKEVKPIREEVRENLANPVAQETEITYPGDIVSHPGSFNELGVDVKGFITTSLESVRKYWDQAKENQEKFKSKFRDAAYQIMTKPATDLRIRGLDSYQGDEGQGMGFENSDLSVLNKGSLAVGKDGRYRGIAVTSGENLKETIGEFAEAYMKLKEIDMTKKAAYVEMIKSDLGIRGVVEENGKWKEFKSRETVLGKPDASGVQHEEVVEVEFKSGIQIPDQEQKRQSLREQDIKNGFVLMLVAENNTDRYRVECFALNRTVDQINSKADSTWQMVLVGAGSGAVSSDLGRLMPKGYVAADQVQSGSESSVQGQSGGGGSSEGGGSSTSTGTSTQEETEENKNKKPKHPNEGPGNGPEAADPGVGNQNKPSNDETGGTPGSPGRKGGIGGS